MTWRDSKQKNAASAFANAALFPPIVPQLVALQLTLIRDDLPCLNVRIESQRPISGRPNLDAMASRRQAKRLIPGTEGAGGPNQRPVHEDLRRVRRHVEADPASVGILAAGLHAHRGSL